MNWNKAKNNDAELRKLVGKTITSVDVESLDNGLNSVVIKVDGCDPIKIQKHDWSNFSVFTPTYVTVYEVTGTVGKNLVLTPEIYEKEKDAQRRVDALQSEHPNGTFQLTPKQVDEVTESFTDPDEFLF